MICSKCKFHQSGHLWNRCNLIDSECYREFNTKPCPVIDDNYNFKEDVEPLGFVKGKSAIDYMEGGLLT